MHDEILADAVTHDMPRQLRHTFALLLLWDEPTEPYELWKKYEADLADDFLHEARQAANDNILPLSESMVNRALLEVEEHLHNVIILVDKLCFRHLAMEKEGNYGPSATSETYIFRGYRWCL
ncbi:TPA: hypothetical protein ACH3X1_008089 [Trebouxia sp. C0004]